MPHLCPKAVPKSWAKAGQIIVKADTESRNQRQQEFNFNNSQQRSVAGEAVNQIANGTKKRSLLSLFTRRIVTQLIIIRTVTQFSSRKKDYEEQLSLRTGT